MVARFDVTGSQQAMFDLSLAAIDLGAEEFDLGIKEVPMMFADEPDLSLSWRCGQEWAALNSAAYPPLIIAMGGFPFPVSL